MLNHILIPYIKSKQTKLDLERKPWLLISNVFKAQWTDMAKEIVQRSNGKMVPVPRNWTNYFQPLDLTVNKSCKDFLRQQAQAWYSNQIRKQMEKGKRTHEIKVDVRISVVKPLHAKWIVKFYDSVRSKPELVKNGWQKAGIAEKINEKINLDPFM